jgi:hypothetical protein
MKTCKQIRKDAWAILGSGKWLWRLLAVAFVLNTISFLVDGAIKSAFAALAIDSMGDYFTHKAQAMQEGLVYTLPSLRAYVWMVAGGIFQTFIAYVFGAVALFGCMRSFMKAEANDDRNWFRDAFAGFSRPFEMVWFLGVLHLRILLWALLFLVPGLVAVYRYRQAWFLKVDHPDWTSSHCLAESCRLMKGWKGKALWLDVVYLLQIFCVMFFFVLTASVATAALPHGVFGMLFGAVGFLLGVGSFFLVLKIAVAACLARVVLYRETLAGKPADSVS